MEVKRNNGKSNLPCSNNPVPSGDENNNLDFELLELKKIKNKDKTDAQKSRYAELMKQDRNQKEKLRKATLRSSQSTAVKEEIKNKDRKRKASEKDILKEQARYSSRSCGARVRGCSCKGG